MTYHVPVLLHQILEGLQCREKRIFLDCTVGCGGHAASILTQHSENRVIGIDRDVFAIRIARQRLEQFADRVTLYHERFERFERVVQLAHPENTGECAPRFDGILFDLGVSSLQLDDAQRGFSFKYPGPLDMRMDQKNSGELPAKTAYGVVNTYSVQELTGLFFRYGEERHSRRIARQIVAARTTHPVETTRELAEIVARAIPKRFHPKRIHPATRVFQAVRIEVNDELQHLGDTLERAVQYLRPGGRICVISFHSLEDRIVKHTFSRLAKGCQCPPDFPMCVCGKHSVVKIISRKPIMASVEEQSANPRSRSAKLRIAQKLSDPE